MPFWLKKAATRAPAGAVIDGTSASALLPLAPEDAAIGEVLSTPV